MILKKTKNIPHSLSMAWKNFVRLNPFTAKPHVWDLKIVRVSFSSFLNRKDLAAASHRAGPAKWLAIFWGVCEVGTGFPGPRCVLWLCWWAITNQTNCRFLSRLIWLHSDKVSILLGSMTFPLMLSCFSQRTFFHVTIVSIWINSKFFIIYSCSLWWLFVWKSLKGLVIFQKIFIIPERDHLP